MGPLIGGLLAQYIGYKDIFYITGVCLFIATVFTMLLVKENFDRKSVAAKPKVPFVKGLRQIAAIPQLPALYSVTILIQFAFLSTNPIMPLYVQELYGPSKSIALFAGLVSSITGFSNMISSPVFGKWGDKLGAEKILGFCLVGAALSFVPQALVQNVWQLLGCRFLLGIFYGGSASLGSVLDQQIYSRRNGGPLHLLQYERLGLRQHAGPVMGGVFSGLLGVRGIFYIAAALLVGNFFWVRKSLIRRAHSLLELDPVQSHPSE